MWRDRNGATRIDPPNGADQRQARAGGLAAWLLRRLSAPTRRKPRLELLERIAVAPRQTVALIEADGRRLLIATSADGAPAFYALDGPGPRAVRLGDSRPGAARTAW